MAQTDTVVLLGGTGFIGRELLSLLMGKVAAVRVVGRRADGLPAEGNVEYVSGNVGDAARMLEVIRGATAVFHLTIEADYEIGVTNVIRACLEHGVRRLIYASTSDALYLGKRGVVYETDPPDSRPELRNYYSRGKGRAERILLETRKKRGLGVVIVRPCLVVGRGGHLQHGGIGRWCSPTCCLVWGNGRNLMPWVLVNDVAQGFALALDAPGIEGMAFNLGGDVYISTRQYIDILRIRTKRNFRMKSTNLSTFYLNLLLRKLAGRLATGKTPDIGSYRNLKSSCMFSQIDNAKAKAFLGWKPNASLDVFIREAIDVHIPPFPEGDLRLTSP